MEKRQIQVDQELNAIVEYDVSFRFILSRDDLKEYNKGFVNWHKQPSIEISVVCEGAVNVYVLEHEQTVRAGDGFFVMPGYLHSIQPAPGYDAACYFTLIFYPEILYGQQGNYFDIAYYRPIADSGAPFFTFSCSDKWTKEVFDQLQWVADHHPDESPVFRLKTQRILQDVWIAFAHNLPLCSTPKASPRHTRKTLDLIGYLHEHHQEKFSLQAMADAASLSRSECCRYFKQMMHMTITEYLLEYRLAKAVALLENSGLRVIEIAEQTGFCDVSYFIKMFRRRTGMTPRVYAQRHRLTDKQR